MMGAWDGGRDLKSLCWRRRIKNSEVDEPFLALFGGAKVDEPFGALVVGLGQAGLHTYGPTWGLAWGRRSFFRGNVQKWAREGNRGSVGERRFE